MIWISVFWVPLGSSKLVKMLGFKGYLPLPLTPTPRSKPEFGQSLLSREHAKLRGRGKTEKWDSPEVLHKLCTLLVWYPLTRLLAFNISNIETHVDAVLHHYFELCTFTVSQTTSNKCVSSFAQIVLLVCQLKIWTDLWHRDGALLGQLLFGLLAGIRVTEVRVEILVQNLCRLLAEVASFPPGERGIMSTDRSSIVSISRYTIKGYYRRSVYFH